MSGHSRLSPSSSSRWLGCTSSVRAIEDDVKSGVIVVDNRPDNIANPAAYWGTQCHTISEMMLLNKSSEEIAKAVPESLHDDELNITAEAYVEYVHNLMRPNSILMVEHRVLLGAWIPSEFNDKTGEAEEQGGTADAIIVHTDNTIDMIDLKGGMGMVFAKDNPQLKIYSGGILEEFDLIRPIKKIRTHIVQPRRDHYDVEEYTYDEIMAFMEYEVAPAAASIHEEFESVHTKFEPSDKACQWCPRAGYCEAQTAHVTSDIVASIDHIDDELEVLDPDSLTVKQLIRVQAKSAEIQSFLKSVEKRIFERLTSGAKTTGYKLVAKNTNRKWAADEETLDKVLEGMGLEADEIWDDKIKSISAIEKLLNAKQKKQLAAYITKPDGAPTLAPTSDKRPAIKPALTQKEMMEIEDNG